MSRALRLCVPCSYKIQHKICDRGKYLGYPDLEFVDEGGRIACTFGEYSAQVGMPNNEGKNETLAKVQQSSFGSVLTHRLLIVNFLLLYYTRNKSTTHKVFAETVRCVRGQAFSVLTITLQRLENVGVLGRGTPNWIWKKKL
jgi:hypothetical protein